MESITEVIDSNHTRPSLSFRSPWQNIVIKPPRPNSTPIKLPSKAPMHLQYVGTAVPQGPSDVLVSPGSGPKLMSNVVNGAK